MYPFGPRKTTTAGLPSGPLTVSIAAGGRDQTGHTVPAGFTVKTGIYWHDREHRVSLRYPALIQIPNDEFARDQNGLQAADVIFEYLAEGGITRLTAVYENAPNLIGPMRSARFISLKIGRHYRGLLFQSGESAATRARAASDPTPQFFDTIGYQYRTGARYAPDNLMINGDRVAAAENNFFGGISTYTIPKARPDLRHGRRLGGRGRALLDLPVRRRDRHVPEDRGGASLRRREPEAAAADRDGGRCPHARDTARRR